MKTQRPVLAALVLLPLLVACGAETPAGGGSGDDDRPAGADDGAAGTTAGPAVTGVRWAVDSLVTDGETLRAPTGTYLRIAEDGQATGTLGCNGFSSTATVDGDTIRFDGLGATEIGCDDVTMAFEESFARTLTDGELTAEAPGDGTLTLTAANGDTVRLSEERPAALLGTRWQVNTLLSGDLAQDLPGDAWLRFDEEDGEVTGNLGCNRVSAPMTVTDGQITLGSPSVTRRMCDDTRMETERTLLALFDGTVDYEIDHRNLTLTDRNGEGVGAHADM